jgi:alpha-L-rhamnosidase
MPLSIDQTNSDILTKHSIQDESMRTLVCSIIVLGFLQSAAGQKPSSTNDPRGPIASWVGHTLVNDQGVQTLNYRYQLDPNDSSWNPSWIWVQNEELLKKQILAVDFRKEFTLSANNRIERAYAKVSADQVYRLWVNGVLISRGPDDPGSDVAGPVKWSHQWLYNHVDLTSYLQPGKNVIAVEVITGDGLSAFSMGKSGFAFEATITRKAGPPLVVSTSDHWKARTSGTYSLAPIASAYSSDESGLHYDARRELPAWRLASFSDSAWQTAKRIHSVWGSLRASQIPHSMEAIWPVHSISQATPNVTTTAPLARLGEQIRLAGGGSFSVNYDRVLSGYISIKVRGPVGTVIKIEPAELKSAPHPMRAAQVTLGKGYTFFEFPDYDSFSTVKITVSHTSEPVVFDDVRATFVSQPVRYRGSFESSDEALNRLWIAARWLTQICMQNRYLDSPHNQEPLGDPGDYMIEALENDYAFDEPSLTRQDLRKFASMLDHNNEATFHTSYELLWLQMLMNYYDFTGDETLLRELAPTANRLLDHFATFQGTNGILSEAPNYMFMDWVTMAGFNAHHPPSVIGQGYLTAFYYQALADGARLATLVGDNDRELKYEQLRRKIRSAFERELWDEKAGLYRDGKPYANHEPTGPWLPTDKEIETHSAQVNALAVLYDLAPKSRQKLILEKLFSKHPLNVQPYFMHFLFAAEDHAGVFDKYAWSQMQRWHLNPETHTFSESWNAGDQSHAWGGTPLIQMSSRILGVKPASPGYKRVTISPHLCNLDWARGTVPTPLGDVEVSWVKKDLLFTLKLKTPADMEADVDLPSTDFADNTLTVDGKPTSTVVGKLMLTGRTHIITATLRGKPN